MENAARNTKCHFQDFSEAHASYLHCYIKKLAMVAKQTCSGPSLGNFSSKIKCEIVRQAEEGMLLFSTKISNLKFVPFVRHHKNPSKKHI